MIRISFAFCLILMALGAFSQNSIRGFVYDKKTGEPVLFASVVLKGTSYGVSTDVNGYYSLTKIPDGTFELAVSSIEHDIFSEKISLSDKKVISKNIYLERKTIQIGTAEVSTEKQEQETQVRMSVKTISPKEIKQLPTIGGQADIAQYLQVLPGVVFTGDQGGQLYIRGGAPVQNKVLLDGMIVYSPFHSIGLFSVFDTDVIRNADVYTGGFNAEHGGRISSIMDITTRDGNKQEFKGRVSMSPLMGKITLEGPLKKPTEENGGNITYILSGKRAFITESSNLLYTYVNEEGLPFDFTDLYGKVTFGANNGSKASVFGFNFTDQVRYLAISDLNWRNSGGGLNFVVIPDGSPVLINGIFSVSDYAIRLVEDNVNRDRFSEVGGFNFGLDFKYILGEDEVKYGVQIVGLRTNFETFSPTGLKIEQQENTTELAGFLVYKKTWGNLIVEPSFRAQYYSSLSNFSPEPRIGAKYKVSPRLRLKTAAGLYSQNLIATNSDRDVVNLFYGYLNGPSNVQSNFLDRNGNVREVRNSLQKAQHAIAGFEYDLTEKLNLNVEAYHIWFSQLTNTNRNKIFPDNSDMSDIPDVFKKDFILEEGRSKGVDMVLKYEDRDLYLWFVYSIAKVDRWDGINLIYAPVFDRRHNMNFVASYTFGKDRNWEAGARWNFGSGLPFTQTLGYYEPVEAVGGVAVDYVYSNTNDLGVLYADLNEGRLPAYHRLDLNLKRSFKLGNNVKMDANFSATNAYSRDNIFYIDRVTGDRVDQLPLIPAIGVEISF
jgi:hypothetical protein